MSGLGATPPPALKTRTLSPVLNPCDAIVMRLFVVLTSAGAKFLESVVLGGNSLNWSPTLRTLENEVPEPLTRTDPEAIVTFPPPVTFPLI
jgi:hypothetical protein